MSAFNLKPIISVVDKVTGPMKAISRALGRVGELIGEVGIETALSLGVPHAMMPTAGAGAGAGAEAAGAGKGGGFTGSAAVARLGDEALGRLRHVPGAVEAAASVAAINRFSVTGNVLNMTPPLRAHPGGGRLPGVTKPGGLTRGKGGAVVPLLVRALGGGGNKTEPFGTGPFGNPGSGAMALTHAIPMVNPATTMTVPAAIGTLGQHRLPAVSQESIRSQGGRTVPNGVADRKTITLFGGSETVATFKGHRVALPMPRIPPEPARFTLALRQSDHAGGLRTGWARGRVHDDAATPSSRLGGRWKAVETVPGRLMERLSGLPTGDASNGRNDRLHGIPGLKADGVAAGMLRDVARTLPTWGHDTQALVVVARFSRALDAAAIPDAVRPSSGESVPAAPGRPHAAGMPDAPTVINPVLAAGDRAVTLTGDMTVSFEGAPPGLRVEPLKTNQPDVESKVHVGYRSLAMGT